MAKIKRKYTSNFTTVQNTFLKDTKLGWSERGLLMTMLSLPDGWDFSAKGLSEMQPDGRDKTQAVLKKLEKNGYLRRSRIYENGKVIDWLYEFCDEPVFLDEVTEQKESGPKSQYNSRNKTENNIKKLETENPVLQKNTEVELEPDFLEVENLEVGFLEVENPSDNKYTKKENTKEENTIQINSIQLKDEHIEMKRNELKVKINYDHLTTMDNDECINIENKAILDELIDVITTEFYFSADDLINVGSRKEPDKKPKNIIINQLNKGLTMGAALSYLYDLRQKAKILRGNPTQYIKKTIYQKCLVSSTQNLSRTAM